MTRLAELDVMDQDDGEHGSIRIDWFENQVYVAMEYGGRGRVGMTLDLQDLKRLIRRLTEAAELAARTSA